MLDQILSTFTAKDAMVVVGCAVSTYFVAREALRRANAANSRVDRLTDGDNGRPGLPERVTRLEEGRKTDRVELLRVRDNAHLGIQIGSSLIGYTDHALDIVGDAVGRPIPHPPAPKIPRLAPDTEEADGPDA